MTMRQQSKLMSAAFDAPDLQTENFVDGSDANNARNEVVAEGFDVLVMCGFAGGDGV